MSLLSAINGPSPARYLGRSFDVPTHSVVYVPGWKLTTGVDPLRGSDTTCVAARTTTTVPSDRVTVNVRGVQC